MRLLSGDEAWRRAGELCDARDVDGLAAMLQSPDEGTRLAAAANLGDTGSKQAAAPLLVALRDRNRRVRTAAARSLGKVAGEDAVPALIRGLQQPYEPERVAAVEALGRIGSSAATRPLAGLLSDRSMRWTAAKALARIGDPDALESLRGLQVARHRFLFRGAIKTAIEDIERRQADRDQRTLRALARVRLELSVQAAWEGGVALIALGVASVLFGLTTKLLVSWLVAAAVFIGWSAARNKDVVRDKALAQARLLPHGAEFESALETIARTSWRSVAGPVLLAIPSLAALGALAGDTALFLALFAGARMWLGFVRLRRLLYVTRRERGRAQRLFHEPGLAPVDRHRFFVSM